MFQELRQKTVHLFHQDMNGPLNLLHDDTEYSMWRLADPFPQIDAGAMMIVWRVREKIIGSVLCSIMCNSCAQCNVHTYEQT